MVNKKIVLGDYQIIKNKAKKYFKLKKFEKCLATIEAAAYLAYNFNFIYVDEELEDMIQVIGSELINVTFDFVESDYSLVFYDSFGYDNKGLTQQYIRALMSMDLKFIYILESDINLNQSKNILLELKAYTKATVHIMPHKLSRIEKIKEITEIISKVSVKWILTHRTPFDTVGNAVFSNIKQIPVYHINLTDHAFWLGKNAADYFIEFRSYGANISLQQRGIDKKKLIHLPFYPIVTDSDFEGFPKNISKDAVKLFTGANFYKMYGDDGKFFVLLKSVLDQNVDAVLLIAGSGDKQPIDDFILENNFQDRVFLLGNRKDINQVFQNIDIYIATYPITGGLMAQYAAMNKKPVIAYTKPDLLCNILEEIVPVKDYQITYFDEKKFTEEFNKLIRNSDYRDLISAELENLIIKPEIFAKNLHLILYHGERFDDFKDYKVDVEKFADLYMQTENSYLHSYSSFIFWYCKATGFGVENKFYTLILKYVLKNFRRKFLEKFKFNKSI